MTAPQEEPRRVLQEVLWRKELQSYEINSPTLVTPPEKLPEGQAVEVEDSATDDPDPV